MKKIYFVPLLILFISINYINAQQYADKIDAVLDGSSSKIRGKIKKDGDKYTLYFFDKYEKDSDVALLQSKGYHGGGPSWLAILYSAFNIYEDNIIDAVNYNVDISGISFSSTNKEDLELIAKVIALIKEDKAVFNDLIAEAKKLDIMK